MSHTPGPWTAKPMGGRILLNGSNCYEVTEVFNDEGGFNPADINLMAAAPDLLDACKYMLENAESQGWSEFMLGSARAAISKAEGRSE